MYTQTLTASFAVIWLGAASAVDPTTPACVGKNGGMCASGSKNESMLLQHWHNASKFDAEARQPKFSCIDGVTPFKDIIPADKNPDRKPEGWVETCQYDVRWEPSQWLQDLWANNNIDGSKYKFKACWKDDEDPEVRAFPFVIANTGNWRTDMMERGSVVMSLVDVSNLWRDGYQQVLPDMLEYYAHKGEIFGRKIIPKFILFGWSKGCTFNHPLARWRPDVVQGVACLHGCNGKQLLGKEHFKKSSNSGSAPIVYFKSDHDGFLDCAAPDSKKAKKFQKDNCEGDQCYADLEDDPCGHYPSACMPLCEPMKFFIEPFWAFFEMAQAFKPCVKNKNQEKCEAELCIWDEELTLCHPEHPTDFGEECAPFCSMAAADSCEGLDEATCPGSYAAVDGWFQKCVFTDGACAQNDKPKQCLYQEKCPSLSALAKGHRNATVRARH